MAPTEGGVAKPERRWDCHRGTGAIRQWQGNSTLMLKERHTFSAPQGTTFQFTSDKSNGLVKVMYNSRVSVVEMWCKMKLCSLAMVLFSNVYIIITSLATTNN